MGLAGAAANRPGSPGFEGRRRFCIQSSPRSTDPVDMEYRQRRKRLAPFSVAATLLMTSTGCSVLETINDIGKDTSPKPAAATPAAESATSGEDGSAQAKLRAYYNRKPRKKAAEEDPNNPIVSCRVGGGTQFLRKYDCELRGGSFKS